MTLRQFITDMLKENDDTATVFNTTVSPGTLQQELPTEDNMEAFDRATWSTEVHVWTDKFAYAILCYQAEPEAEFEWITTAIPLEPSRNTVSQIVA